MIQIDIEMPKNCLECPMWTLSTSGFMCNIKEAIVDSNMETERPDWCPLREVTYECGQKSVEEQPKGNEKNGKGCWNCRHRKRVHKELVGEEWRCDLNNCCFGYHTVINHWCRHWANRFAIYFGPRRGD